MTLCIYGLIIEIYYALTTDVSSPSAVVLLTLIELRVTRTTAATSYYILRVCLGCLWYLETSFDHLIYPSVLSKTKYVGMQKIISRRTIYVVTVCMWCLSTLCDVSGF